MPTSSTGPEVRLRRLLHARGLRFTLHRRDLPGRPDIVLTRARIAVFVDGCFWHACPIHGNLPKANREWWADKLARNVERDRCQRDQLEALGWLPVTVWEHDDPTEAAGLIEGLWRQRTGRESV